MAQHSGKFKLVVMKVESEVMSDTSWEVIEDLDRVNVESAPAIADKVLVALNKARTDCAGWNAENARIMAGG